MTSSATGDAAYYDRLAAKFGGYQYEPGDPTAYRFPDGSPEEAFDALVGRFAEPGATALDVGCADGANTLRLAPLFAHITGIDVSEGMLEVARRTRTELGMTNAHFEAIDGERAPYADASFDFIYSRRGPTFYAEFERLLKPGGVYAEIQIGDRDARTLKELFGRGQDFGAWHASFLERNTDEITTAGLEVIEAREYVYDDLYTDIDHLSLFLEGVPIFTDYDVMADRPKLEEYVAAHIRPEGVVLERHRVVIVARKLA